MTKIANKAPRKPTAKPDARTNAEVTAFMAALKHPLKKQIEAARRIILGAAPGAGEALKWNAPSFQTTVFFATVNLRTTDRVEFIFHKGAKKEAKPKPMTIPDPQGLVKWLAPDRALVTFRDTKAFAAIVRAWIGQL